MLGAARRGRSGTPTQQSPPHGLRRRRIHRLQSFLPQVSVPGKCIFSRRSSLCPPALPHPGGGFGGDLCITLPSVSSSPAWLPCLKPRAPPTERHASNLHLPNTQPYLSEAITFTSISCSSSTCFQRIGLYFCPFGDYFCPFVQPMGPSCLLKHQSRCHHEGKFSMKADGLS